jgi:hypothetical protein
MFSIILILILIVFVYLYLKLKHFTLYGPIPGLSPEFLFGNMRQIGMISRNESIPNVHLKLKEYQFWVDPSRFIRICNVEHIFTHRNIYEQGDVHINKFSLLFHDGIICILKN